MQWLGAVVKQLLYECGLALLRWAARAHFAGQQWAAGARFLWSSRKTRTGRRAHDASRQPHPGDPPLAAASSAGRRRRDGRDQSERRRGSWRGGSGLSLGLGARRLLGEEDGGLRATAAGSAVMKTGWTRRSARRSRRWATASALTGSSSL